MRASLKREMYRDRFYLSLLTDNTQRKTLFIVYYIPYGGKLWQQENLLQTHIDKRKFGEKNKYN